MGKPVVSRRRFITICAAAGGLALIPSGRSTQATATLVSWRGTMLGAVATLQIHHTDRSAADRLLEGAVAEARRLEALFSLYRRDSALVELNRAKIIVDPAAELVDLMTRSRRYAELTDGAFDPTVQPLWTLYADHFSRPDADPAGPPAADLRRALSLVGYGQLMVSKDRIALSPGGAVTLNGIAQGYVTDRIVDFLRERGVGHSLVDMGEARAMGTRPDGGAWEIGIADPEHAGRQAAVLPVIDRAVSTSGAYGFQFDPQGRFNHLFDARTGGCARRYRSVTTVATTATAADAASTAFSFMAEDRIRSLMPALGIERVHLITAAGAATMLTT